MLKYTLNFVHSLLSNAMLMWKISRRFCNVCVWFIYEITIIHRAKMQRRQMKATVHRSRVDPR
jgi:hypothetical protein